ncbi:T9SS type A sorting domain-containing protein [Chitinophaga vietnamensis]|uniref:T9SS type A sorting domain-containing protein n=1 Tax=Chitinophaga vietnamensis TaxID=2593957 RepID=UPI001375CDE9|nr:T9SS type A sorting domain-containing protein [Chitinophaga vietnamensis]
MKLYPNPATTTIYFEIQPQQHTNDRTYDLIVYNFLGKKMEQLKGISNRTPLNLDNYYSGLYIYQLRDQRGNLIESGKFNVVK